MKRIQYNVVERDTKDASGKAKTDAARTLDKYSFERMYQPASNQYIRVLQQLLAIMSLPKDSCVFVQYPANKNICYKALAKKNVRKIAIIHDISSLRGEMEVPDEINILSMFDFIISHNSKMTKFLKDNGISSEVIELNIFDYLVDHPFPVTTERIRNQISFAGNLSKSKFLFNLGSLKGIEFVLYGKEIPEMDKLKNQPNVEYKGSYSSEKLLEVIEGGWGLVWDGDSLETCNGVTGEYLRYNCPHKVSMYVVSERPIIIWKEAAMADYVVDHGLGIAVNSLYDVPKAIENVTEKQYQSILKNIKNEKERLITGGTLGSIIEDKILGKYC